MNIIFLGNNFYELTLKQLVKAFLSKKNKAKEKSECIKLYIKK